MTDAGSSSGRGGKTKRVLFDATRQSKRVTQAVKLGRPETVYKKVLSDAEQAEQLDHRQRVAADARRRRVQKRLNELEKTNYRDANPERSGYTASVEGVQAVSSSLANMLAMRREGLGEKDRTVTHDLELMAAIEVCDGTSSSSGRERRGKQTASKEHWTPAVRKILSTRRTFGSIIADAAEFPSMHAKPNYFSAQAAPSRHASQSMCSVCGYWGAYSCVRCEEKYCSRKCGATHESARCDQRG
ncbi:hypothetical protein V8E36_000764 [Tilletia maclaganii]